MSSGSKKKEPRYAFFYSVRSSSKRTSSRFPKERAACLQGLFYMSLKFLIKISLNKEIFPFFQGPWKGVSLHVTQQPGPYGNRRQFPERYVAYPLRSPLKDPSLQVPLIELPRRETPHP
jgi:hypothetical protein